MAVVVFGGLINSAVLTLFVLPGVALFRVVQHQGRPA